LPKQQVLINDSSLLIPPKFVVAIGASAGGLEALEQYFGALLPDTGAAYIVIQHLSPDHKSMMHTLLARYTSLPILVVTNELKILANHVYLIPPGVIMTIHGDKLYLSPKEPHVLSLPIDLFYISLASAYGDKSVGIVLSGTGSDGTRGAVAINDAGGFVMAQEPESAAFDGMPRSLISTGIVDLILTPIMLAKRTADLVQQVKPHIDKPDISQAKLTSPMERIFQLLYEVGRINFKEYKSVTVKRRIERRMQIRGAQSISEYLALMEKDRTEVAALKRDTLIPVTSFFRDREAFDVLEKLVIPNIIRTIQSDSPIRIWVCGCATGEEAYSLAILFFEVFEKLNYWGQLKIFATDVEQHYIDIASAGVYPEATANELSEQRLQRYFTHVNGNYVIRSEIRQKIIFAKHNVLEDPPFTRMDLVTCRNMLIYFNAEAQERALQRFQYALIAKAYFFQGSSESLGKRQKDFTTIDSKHKIYQLNRELTLPLHFKSSPISQLSAGMKKSSQITPISDESAAIDTGEELLLGSYAPPAILVNQERALVHSYGDVSAYIQIHT
jgi:two-component system, chemotaxis family, CheB/CheR fusion protein